MLGPRIAAALIDLAILFVVLVVVGVTAGGATANGDTVLPDLTATTVFVVLVSVYYLTLETVLGRTVGKLLMGLRIVGWDGGRPSVVASAIRTLLRIVDWLPVLYVIGFIAMVATGARRQRLGDLAAETRVERTAPIRHRGLVAALLAFVLVVALAVSLIPLIVLDASVLTASSSVCTDDRCNATAHGNQVLELAERDVEVSAIGAGRATFTVDGHTVALRVGETRPVGSSLVHLAVADGAVARFTIDFSGLFVGRSDPAGEPGVAPGPSTPSMLTDDRRIVTVAVPTAWNDVDGSENVEYGPRIRAAPDLDRFRDTWDVPGIIVEASQRYGPQDIAAIMGQLGPAEDCTSGGREVFDHRRYTGAVERWTECGGTATTVVTAGLAPTDGSYVIRVFGQAVYDRDLAAIEAALTTIRIVGIDGAPSGPSVWPPPPTSVSRSAPAVPTTDG